MSASAPWRDRTFGLGMTTGALTKAVQGQVLEAGPHLGYAHLQRDRPEAFAPMADLVRHIAGNPFRDTPGQPAGLPRSARWPRRCTRAGAEPGRCTTLWRLPGRAR
jgi:hypothetical protein